MTSEQKSNVIIECANFHVDFKFIWFYSSYLKKMLNQHPILTVLKRKIRSFGPFCKASYFHETMMLIISDVCKTKGMFQIVKFGYIC